jgi:hypothetical protein
MEGNMKAFSFDSVLLDKIKTPSLVAKTSFATLPQVVKLVDTFKTKALKENQTFYRNILESDSEVTARKAYDQFFGTLTRLNAFYTAKYVDVLDDNLKRLNNEGDSRLINVVNEYLKDFNNNDILMEREMTQFVLDDEIPCSKNILTSILHFFGDNFYELSEEDARKLLEITTNNQSKIIKRAKAEIIDADPDDIEVKDLSRTPDIFVGETTTKSFHKECVGKCIEIVKSVRDDLEANLDNARLINKEYKKLLNKVIQYRNSTKIRVNSDDYIRKIERIIISMISEIWTYHLTVYAIKAQYICNNYYQAKGVLARISMMANEEFVDDTVEAVAVESTKFLKEEAFKFTKLTDAEILMNHITDMKHNDLIMDCCIKEAMILAEGVDVENRLAALHEGAWDKVKEFFNKIKTFVMALFDKVSNWFDKFFKSNKDYIEKYKDQIDKPTAGFTTVNMPNYKEGLNRIQAAPNINFNGVISTANGMPENADVDKVINDFRKTIINEYKDDDDWKETCNNYFKGGKDSDKDYSANEISIRELANQVLNIPKIVDNIKKDKSTSDQMFKSLESAINKAASQQPASTPADSSNTSSTPSAPTSTPAAPAAAPAQGTQHNSTYLYGDVFSEFELNQTNAPTPGATGSNSASITASGNQTIDNVKNGGVDAKTAVNAQKIVNRIASTYSTYLQCKYQMAEKIMSDYMKIIKAHVSAYVNANNDSEKAQQAN